VRFGFSRRDGASPATVEVTRVARGRSIPKRGTRVARFTNRSVAFTWNGRGTGNKRLADGWYVARLSAKAAGRTDVRRVALRVRKGRVTLAKAFTSAPACSLVQSFGAGSPVFGGSRRVPVRLSYRLAQATKVSVQLLRGKRTVRRVKTRTRKGGQTYSVRFGARGLRPGTYRLRLVAGSGRGRVTRTITVRRL
jgi:hypothetical protein